MLVPLVWIHTMPYPELLRINEKYADFVSLSSRMQGFRGVSGSAVWCVGFYVWVLPFGSWILLQKIALKLEIVPIEHILAFLLLIMYDMFVYICMIILVLLPSERSSVSSVPCWSLFSLHLNTCLYIHIHMFSKKFISIARNKKYQVARFLFFGHEISVPFQPKMMTLTLTFPTKNEGIPNS